MKAMVRSQHSTGPVFSFFFFSSPFFGHVLLNYNSIFLYILRRRLALRLCRLKGKKEVRRHESPYRLKNYAQ
jgi:hypothetical protein